MRNWLAVAASVPGFIGFAVEPHDASGITLVAWRSKKATREQAVAEIAGRYRRVRRPVRAGRPASPVCSVQPGPTGTSIFHGELTHATSE